MTASESIQKYAALLGATGVALGAMGSHALKDTLTKTGHLESWRTGISYQLFHATALIGVAALAKNCNPTEESNLLRAGQFMAIGSLLFSGSIYGLSLGIGPKKLLGPTTPIGKISYIYLLRLFWKVEMSCVGSHHFCFVLSIET